MEQTRIELTKELKDIIVKGMRDLCDDADYDFDSSAFNYNLDAWALNKAHLMSVLSKDSDFNANELAIVKDVEINREIDIDNAEELLGSWLKNAKFPYGAKYALLKVMSFIKEDGTFDMSNSYFNDEKYEMLKDSFEFHKTNYDFNLIPFIDLAYRDFDDVYALGFLIRYLKIQNGTKATKVLNKIFDTFKGLKVGKHNLGRLSFVKGVRELDENGNWTGNMCKVLNFNQFQAQLNDLLSPKVEKKKLVISINPLDYITQSHGNSWGSCHAFNSNWDKSYSGCNKGATLTMMCDPSSVIAYILDGSAEENNLWNIPKQNRQSLFINEDHDYIMQNVFYPNHSDYLSKVVRQTIQNLFSVTDDWVHGKRIDWNRVTLDTSEYKGYDDWCKGVDISYLKDNNDKDIVLTIGRDAYCVDYCEYIEDNSSVCSEHSGKVYCEYCNDWEYEDDMYWSDYYGRYICDRELDNEFYHCEDTNDYRVEYDCWYNDYDGYYYSNDTNYEYVEDYGYVDEYNLENSGDFFQCEECGNWFYCGYENMNEHDYCYYCDSCYEDLELDEEGDEE